MKTAVRKGGMIGLVATGMSVVVALPAAASGQDGLVNVNVGNVTILRDVNVATVVPVVAQLCSIDLTVPANLALLSNAAQKVDATGKSYTVCKAAGGHVKLVQN